MADNFSDLDLEIESLLAGIGYNPEEDNVDDSTTLNRTSAELASDFDGTPIIGTEKKTKKILKPTVAKEVKVSNGRGRPQDKTIDFSHYTDVNMKLGILFGALYKKFGQETITLLQHQNLLEIVILDNDGDSSCQRVRIYVGEINKTAHGRDKCKGRFNCYERKGVYPLVELIAAVSSTVEKFVKK